jgi:hypothetical protein
MLTFKNIFKSASFTIFILFFSMIYINVSIAATGDICVDYYKTGGNTTNCVKSADINAAAVTGAKIATGTVTGSNIASSTITGGKIAAGTITGSNIANGTVTGANVAVGTITGTNIANGTVGTAQIQDGSITSSKLNLIKTVVPLNFTSIPPFPGCLSLGADFNTPGVYIGTDLPVPPAGTVVSVGECAAQAQLGPVLKFPNGAGRVVVSIQNQNTTAITPGVLNFTVYQLVP